MTEKPRVEPSPVTETKRSSAAGGVSKAGVYVLRSRRTGVDLYIDISLDVPVRLAQHARPGSPFLKTAAMTWPEIEPVVVSLPKATPAMLSAIEVLIIGGIGRIVEPGGSLVNRGGGGGGGGGGHNLTAAELTMRATKATATRRKSQAARKAWITRRGEM